MTSPLLTKSFSGGPGGQFFKNAPLAAGGNKKSILTLITDQIREAEQENFHNFFPSEFTLKHRPDPIDILPLIEQNFFIIAESKKGSPSKGIIRENYHPVFIAAGYRQAGASAVSVITEEQFFYGSKRHLPMVKENVDLPVLRKDFIVHPFQVYESYNLGADFILLIAACLTDSELNQLYSLALSLGMQVLIEVHTQEELNRVLPLKPKLIGINNRDLRSFHVDMGTSFRLKQMVPGDVFVISESGIRTGEDIRKLRDAGFAGVLIGETLLKENDPSDALKKLLKDAFGDQGGFFEKRESCPPWTPRKTFINERVKIKICGVTNAEDYKDAVTLGADFIGFIFYPQSPRYITKQQAAEIISNLPPGNHKKIGVFVNEDIETIKDFYHSLNLDIVQLHGDEPPEFIDRLNLPCWKAIRVENENSLEIMKNYNCDTFLLDTFSKDKYGGTGTAFPIPLAQKALRLAEEFDKKIIISGGISPENIDSILDLSPLPHAVDVNSSIEDSPGKKNRAKMELLFTHTLKMRTKKQEFEMIRPHRFFGPDGGRYVPEMLIPALDQLENFYMSIKNDPNFQEKLNRLLTNYSGRPTPLYFAENLTRRCGGCKIYLKMESLNHTGAHKINNVLGQALMAKKMGKTTVIAETGAGQHGLATAAAAAKMGLKCKVFMGEIDARRQHPNVFAMKLSGAEVIPVSYGTKTLKDAVNAALKYWIENLDHTHYLLGSALGPYPYPLIVRDFQSVIGREVQAQLFQHEKRNPDILVACVGGGSNSIGLFSPFIETPGIEFHGVEAGGTGPDPGQNASRFSSHGKTGIVQGYKSYFLQDENGQVLPTHSISAGLDYAGIGPELANLHDTGKIKFHSVTDDEALHAFQILCRNEGIIPALESAHAVAQALKIAPLRAKNEIMVVNLSGRGDKDIFITARALDRENWFQFLRDEVNNG
jgi:tryptophan synthase beta chain